MQAFSPARQAPAPSAQRMQPRLVLLGPPGAGKGTQAVWLSGATGAAHISTGDLVRAAIAEGTPLGHLLQQYNDRGELVPDEIIVDLVRPHLVAARSWILDGFPRDVAQARALDGALAALGVQLDRAIALQVPDEALIERLQDRRLSAATGTIYNLRFGPPPADDPGPFIQRADDHPEEIRRRLEIYHAKTEPLLAYFAERGVLAVVDASGTVEEVHQKLVAILGT
jgi:adenylate kinase